MAVVMATAMVVAMETKAQAMAEIKAMAEVMVVQAKVEIMEAIATLTVVEVAMVMKEERVHHMTELEVPEAAVAKLLMKRLSL
jgi:hypothetical protein